MCIRTCTTINYLSLYCVHARNNLCDKPLRQLESRVGDDTKHIVLCTGGVQTTSALVIPLAELIQPAVYRNVIALF